MKTLAKILIPVLVLVAAAFGAQKLISMRPEPEKLELEQAVPLVRVVEAVPSDTTFEVVTHGTVQPRTASELVAEVDGRVIRVAPALVNGGFFEAGDLLLEIDGSDYQMALAQARVTLATAARRLHQEQADAALAREEWDALGNGSATPLVLREPQVAEAKASLAAAEAAVERAERDLERTRVRAVFAGRVRNKMADLGQFVTRGKPLAEVYAVDYAEVRLPLPDADLAYIDLPLGYRGERAPGAQPIVELSAEFAGERHVWEATLVRTEGEIDPRTRMVMAVARAEDPYGRGDDLDRPPLAVGMFVEARIRGRRVEGVFDLPREALRGERRIYLMDGDDRLRFRDVEILRADRERVIIGRGLEAGERVVISPLEIVTDGTLLRLPEEAAQQTGTPGAEGE